MDWNEIIRRQERLVFQCPTRAERVSELECLDAMRKIAAAQPTTKERNSA